jgi:glycine C-acetyltransferase/8-amino-7-oxononanoate synthase
MESAPAAETVISGKRYLYFGGTGYYTLQNHPSLLQAATAALARYGMHPATSRGGFGTTPLYVAVEAASARFFGAEDAAYIASGYLCNLAGLQALTAADGFDAIFVDRGSHYSVTDLLPALGLPVVPFAHRDPEDLRRSLRAHLRAGRRALVVSDGIFPLMGHLAPVPAYLEVAAAYDAVLWLDDSHGVGVLGERGRGTCEHYGLASEWLLFGGTLSKAFGAYGGVIPGRKDFVRAVRAGHVMNGATSPTSPAAAAALAGIELLAAHPEWRMRLWDNARMLKSGLRRLGLPVEDSPVPIAAWALESARRMDGVQRALMARGICIQRARYVGAGPAGVLRVVVFSTHTAEQIGRLLEELQRVL